MLILILLANTSILSIDKTGVIATGQTRTLREFVDLVFSEFGLNWPDHVISDPALYRPTDIAEGHANPQKAFDQLGWKATATLEDVERRMVAAIKPY
ncbi:MAG: GDP-mannose 4,6-dehydratase [Rudanella sp.]|nr:GDP-mannose 4,6-dehydratase [Rudanella sp.]